MKRNRYALIFLCLAVAVAVLLGANICIGSVSIPLKEVLSMPVEQWRGFLRNDFEPAVFRKYPQLEAIKESLYGSGAVYAAMSGSGSALFAIYEK